MTGQPSHGHENTFVSELERVLSHLKERLGVAKIGIFGSAARGGERPDSDVDVLVLFAPGQATFRNFMELAYFLEDLFGRRVDLVTDNGLNVHIRPIVEKEVIWGEA